MTEVRQCDTGMGLFATRDYKRGDIILQDEAPLWIIRGCDSTATTNHGDEDDVTRSQLSDYDSFLYYKTKKIDNSRISQWRCMVRAAASFAVTLCGSTAMNADETRKKVLSLYHPNIEYPSEEEVDVVEMAKEALEYCEKHCKAESALSHALRSDHKTDVLHSMLIYALNAFAGGLLYELSCRINHNCDPNCIALPSSDDSPSQMVRATTCIPSGTQLHQSYLGIFTWAGGYARQTRLKQTKCFTCTCIRCTSTPDYASAIPCVPCHPRLPPNYKYLEEDVQWDDNEDIVKVCYSYPKNASAYSTSYCCSTCDDSTQDKNILTLSNKVCQKVFKQLISNTQSTTIDNNNTDTASIQLELEEQLHDLASSTLGARHWTTNLLSLSTLDRTLTRFHATMLLGQKCLDTTELASAIDSLDRLWTYAHSLQLQNLDPSFLLHRQTIGIARSLVALGDVKSMAYGAHWIERVESTYVRVYESEDMIKVVERLKCAAWEQQQTPGNSASTEDNDVMENMDDAGHDKKRLKK